MKLTPIEKQMLVGMAVLLVVSFIMFSRIRNKMQSGGGLKVVVTELWNGNNSSSLND